MAHNIARINGKNAMFATNRAAVWHGLGQRTNDAVTWIEAMQAAGLDWTVIEVPMFARVGPKMDPTNRGFAVTEVTLGKLLYRDIDGQQLGLVGPDYKVIQNAQAFDFCDTLLEASNGAHYESAGALGNGERIWVLARIPAADITVNGGDTSESYLLFATSHDGSLSTTAGLTTVRVVCQNTLRVALTTMKEGQIFRIKHTKSAVQRLEMAKSLMTGVMQDAKQLETKLNTLAHSKLTRESTAAILDKLFPSPKDLKRDTPAYTRRENMLADILKLYELNDGNAYPDIRGTGYNLLNAVTEWTDHLRSARITENRTAAGYTPEMARCENAMFGTGDQLKSKALDTILEVVGTDGKVRSVTVPNMGPSNDSQSGTGSLLDTIIDNSQVN